ncbi:MAG: hypothetical protein ACLFWD_12170 [Anaerolineales bacterium]
MDRSRPLGCFSWIRVPIQLALVISLLTVSAFACGQEAPTPTAAESPSVCNFDDPEFAVASNSRPFHMGFSRWPPAATEQAMQRLNTFLGNHADMTLIHLDSGVPWPEALAGETFSDHVQNDWSYNLESVPEGHRLFVAITPLNMDRDSLAKYRGSSDNQNLPGAWKDRSLNDPEVQEAYLNYARRAAAFFNPDYFAFGIEVNLTINADEALWRQYRELHEHVYLALKEEHPDLPIFASFTYPDMKGDVNDSAPAEQHQAAVAELVEFNDLLGLSLYPYSYTFGGDGTLPSDYFNLASSYGLPIAITESGMPSEEFTAFFQHFPFEIQHQTNYMTSMLRHATQHDFVFVINWAAIDFEELMKEIPFFLRDLARFWVYTGLETSEGCPKPALQVWDAYLAMPHEQ